MKLRTVSLALVILTLVPSLTMAENKKRPMTIEDLFRFKRVSDPQISPDGGHVAYVVGDVDLPGNKITSRIWLAPTGEGEPKQLTNSGKKDSHPRWSPDSKKILFQSNRSGDSQLWVIDVAGGEARQLTTISTGAHTGIWSPDGKSIAFVSSVWPEYSDKPFAESDALNKKRKEETEKNPIKARVFTKLFYRHWDEWVEDKRLHLFVMSFTLTRRVSEGESDPSLTRRATEPRDVTPGDRDAYPTSSTFSVGDDFTFSPDSKYLVYTAPPEKNEAWSTNYDIWRVEIEASRGRKPPENLTKDNLAADGCPRFSPDGRFIAYRAQYQPGNEAAKWEIKIMHTDGKEKSRVLTSKLDSSIDSFSWHSDGKLISVTADLGGYTPLCDLGVGSHHFYPLTSHGSYRSISNASGRVCFLGSAMDYPAEVFVAREKTEPFVIARLAKANSELVSQLDSGHLESVEVKGANNTPMQMWILKPPGFDTKKKWPLAYLVHGGPQGAWEDGWSYRWNPQLWAAQGYVVALPNPRGSTGFGQKYVDEISGDWGGKCYEDLMAGLAYLESQPYIDRERMAAAGASFGGYMMNWFAGHTDKFKTLITHCGVYNFDSMYGTTEELWFDEWEHGGPPWIKRDSYEKFSPHRFAKNFKTPMLIIHNDLDFRVPVSEGLQLFTTLQRMNIPSKMINFPDEGHWVLKPKNSEYWHKEVFAWLKKYCPPGGK